MFDPDEGKLHIDLYRQGVSVNDYDHADLEYHLRPRDPLSAFTRLQQVFGHRPNREYVTNYYRGDVRRFDHRLSFSDPASLMLQNRVEYL
ncbi:hypothetical protein BRD01_14060 [Halobacteriales archaeon QS_8_65_32]|nr:MAG: hypothetical protein BRD01_14060 [Halobacteriales archaeon QS_8_65_32]